MTRLLLAALLLLAAAALASASTLAIAAGPTVCGVAVDNATAYCAGTNNSSYSARAVAPFIGFSQVSSGGGGFVCGLQVGGRAFFCWPTAAPDQLRRVYNGPSRLEGLAVGGGHVAAYDVGERVVRWWRGGERFPAQVGGGFSSLVSGDDFTCAVETNTSAVRCWGPGGSAVQAAFLNASVSTLAAGGSRACGVLMNTGAVLCSGSEAGAVAPRDLAGLAVGDSHACGLLKPNHTAACWSLAGPTTTLYYPAFGTAFEFLVAGGNLSCGLVTTNFSLLCWSTDVFVAAEVPLPTILPGVCVSDANSCKCGVFKRSGELCSVPGNVICNRFCDAPPPPVSPPPPSPSSPPAASRRISKTWIAFAVVGAVGSFAGLCSIVYCLVFGFCSHKKVHNSVQPNIAGNNAAGAAGAADNGGTPSPYGSPNGSQSLGLFRRQLSRVMTRQRSGPSSFKDPAEEFTFAQLAAATKDFALEAKIGEGSFGTVYRGNLADGREVAIKRGESGPRPRKFQEKESAFRIVAGELNKVLDGRAPEPAAHEAEAVELVAYTALHCVRLEGKDRPAMADIVANLETAVALCMGSAAAAGGLVNSSSSAGLSITSMEL
ncbi:hypothetical protein ABZP36_031241 [Zizania latifolia]